MVNPVYQVVLSGSYQKQKTETPTKNVFNKRPITKRN